MEDLEILLEKAWRTRGASFPAVLGADNPCRTRAVSLTGADCALNCAHCGGHYLEAMLPADTLAAKDGRLAGVPSLLISGGCDAQGRVPVRAQLERIRAVRPGRQLIWHTGLIGVEEVQAIAGLVDAFSFDMVGDDETIAEVYGLTASVRDYRATYHLLRRHGTVIPHITIGLRGGRISGEREALRILREEGAEAIVFLVLIPTPGTRYAGRRPPAATDVARLLAEARLAFPRTPLLLGCMRPGAAYRRELDALALRAGVNRIVKPQQPTLKLARDLGLEIEESEECCVLPLLGASAVTLWQPDDSAAARSDSPGPVSIRVSAGTEVVLGLRKRPMETAPTTAYLMLDGGGCAMSCAFCAQARCSQARDDALSRIVWPAHPSEEVFTALAAVPESSALTRLCFQVTVHQGAVEEVQAAIHQARRVSGRPISVALRPGNVQGIATLLEHGVEVVGLGLDCAAERVYREVKGTGWGSMIALVEDACRRFPGRVRVHLVVGLGETEQEFCSALQQVYDWGGAVGLFAFTPIRGTPLEGCPQPPLAAYRRMQAARFLVHNGLARAERFQFDHAGQLTSFGQLDLPALLADGEAFRTSGCPGCNRPYYNERPGGTMYNYPRPLAPEEAAQAIRDMGLTHNPPDVTPIG